jgi:hypothetical protein
LDAFLGLEQAPRDGGFVPASANRPRNLGSRNIAEDVGVQPDRKADGRYKEPDGDE